MVDLDKSLSGYQVTRLWSFAAGRHPLPGADGADIDWVWSRRCCMISRYLRALQSRLIAQQSSNPSLRSKCAGWWKSMANFQKALYYAPTCWRQSAFRRDAYKGHGLLTRFAPNSANAGIRTVLTPTIRNNEAIEFFARHGANRFFARKALRSRMLIRHGAETRLPLTDTTIAREAPNA